MVKAILYQLVSNGFRIVAVAGTEVVLEVSDDEATQQGLIDKVARVVRQAQRPDLDSFAAPCECELQQVW